jgi:Nickel responsive protein SCO4226-like
VPRDQRLEPRKTFFVEHYRPGRDAAQLSSSIARIREIAVEMERAGEPVRYLSATIVPGDESFFCLIEAASEQVVSDAYRRADVPFERISAAICVFDEGENP